MLQIGRTRVRQHVNPLRDEYRQPTQPIDWAQAFQDPSLPLILDLGCGYGRFLLLLNKRHREAEGQVADAPARDNNYNYLGIEIRKPVRHTPW